jgi:hypothetical protein
LPGAIRHGFIGVVKDYDPMVSFDEDAAQIYDDSPRGDEAAAVAFLADLAGSGTALELAIGTGRVALPLAASGVRCLSRTIRCQPDL